MRVWVVTLLCLVPVIARGDSLADVARETTEQRKKAAEKEKATRVYGADDLDGARERRRTESGTPAGTAPDAATKTKPPEPPSSSATDSDRQLAREQAQRVEDEARWRKRVAEATARLEESRARYESMKDVTLYPGQVLVDENNQPVASCPKKFRSTVEEARKEHEAAQQAYDDLMEAARREGVPPGWLR
jgi:chemotaxis protein histidine kinase CheA